jgi:hypothetical protein
MDGVRVVSKSKTRFLPSPKMIDRVQAMGLAPERNSYSHQFFYIGWPLFGRLDSRFLLPSS